MNERIKKIRKALDLTQTEFASRIGTVQNTITGYESGRRNPSGPIISLICKEFGVNEDWLRTGNGEMFLPDTSSEIEALVKRYNLSPADQVLIEKFVNSKKEFRDAITGMFVEAAKAALNETGGVRTLGNETAASAEAAYEKALNIAQNGSSTASNITGAEQMDA